MSLTNRFTYRNHIYECDTSFLEFKIKENENLYKIIKKKDKIINEQNENILRINEEMMKNHQNKEEIMKKLAKNLNIIDYSDAKTNAKEKIIKSKDKEIKLLKSVYIILNKLG